MRASRLVAIVLLLQNRGRLTAPQLAEQLEVSIRTIYRDLDALSASGIRPEAVLRLRHLVDHRSVGSTDWDGPAGADGWRRLTLTFERLTEARTALLGLGDAVEVLGPA